MPFQKGLPRHHAAGRRKGVPNKVQQTIEQKLLTMGCDPIIGMAELALDPKSSRELRGRIFAELAEYVHSKRKAVELVHSGTLGIVNEAPPTIVLIDRLSSFIERLREDSGGSGTLEIPDGPRV